MMYQEAGGWDAFSHYSTIDMIQSVESITDDPSLTTGKILRNGILLIERDGKIFTALGTELRDALK